MLAAAPLWNLSLAAESAAATSCPDVQVVFARGTNEPPGVGIVGQAFADALSAQVGGRSVEVSAVNYPASDNYLSSAANGSDDARAQIQDIIASCPSTKLVLGGYSQGAAVTDMATAAMPPQTADRVAAVALFGTPSSAFSSMLAGGEPLPTTSPAYAAKTIDLCMDGDPICSPGANMLAHVSYVLSGMTNQAASFAAAKIDQH
ncbi:MAG: cutinase family protein [Mycobacterium sp.]|nr:cutinase family protein [Mycobacterium sp.]